MNRAPARAPLRPAPGPARGPGRAAPRARPGGLIDEGVPLARLMPDPGS